MELLWHIYSRKLPESSTQNPSLPPRAPHPTQQPPRQKNDQWLKLCPKAAGRSRSKLVGGQLHWWPASPRGEQTDLRCVSTTWSCAGGAIRQARSCEVAAQPEGGPGWCTEQGETGSQCGPGIHGGQGWQGFLWERGVQTPLINSSRRWGAINFKWYSNDIQQQTLTPATCLLAVG